MVLVSFDWTDCGNHLSFPFPDREIATMTYRSGPEWDDRFGRKRINEDADPSLCPFFMIENYLDYQGESFCMKLDPNTLLYISKVRYESL